VFVTFVLIFKFILIYLLHVLFILKIEGIFEKEKASPKMLKGVVFFIYSIDSVVAHSNLDFRILNFQQQKKKGGLWSIIIFFIFEGRVSLI